MMWVLRRNVWPGIVTLLIVAGAGFVAYHGLRFTVLGHDVELGCFRWVKGVRLPAEDLANGRAAIESTMAWSQLNKDYALLVDKSAYTLVVYKDGDLVAEFPIQLGSEPIKPKERTGDSRTPEGFYRITDRKDIGQTWFYRAFLIDYPTAVDRALGRTGGAIEIHGGGSGTRPPQGWFTPHPGDLPENWTWGCVALSNAHMDTLFAFRDGAKRIGVNTPVTIVYGGSLPDYRYNAVEGPTTRGPDTFLRHCRDMEEGVFHGGSRPAGIDTTT